MKVLMADGNDYYLVDLEKLKPKPIKDVLLEAAGSELVTVSLEGLDTTDLEKLLGGALKRRMRGAQTNAAAPVVKPTTGKTRVDTKPVREWFNALEPEKRKDIWREASLGKQGRIPAEVQTAYEVAHPSK